MTEGIGTKKASRGTTIGRIVAGTIVAGGLILILLLIIGAVAGPKTYADMAEEAAARCIKRGGVGTEWRGSSGVTLETFCKSEASIDAYRTMCRERPARC